MARSGQDVHWSCQGLCSQNSGRVVKFLPSMGYCSSWCPTMAPNLCHSNWLSFWRWNILKVHHTTQLKMVWRSILFIQWRKPWRHLLRSVSQRLAKFLLSYRTSPHATTNQPLCELLMGRPLCMRLDFLKLSNESQALDQQAQQKANHDSYCKGWEFVVGQS